MPNIPIGMIFPVDLSGKSGTVRSQESWIKYSNWRIYRFFYSNDRIISNLFAKTVAELVNTNQEMDISLSGFTEYQTQIRLFISIYKMHDVIVRDNQHSDEQRTLCRAFYQEFGSIDPQWVHRYLSIKSRVWWALEFMPLHPGLYRLLHRLYRKLIRSGKRY